METVSELRTKAAELRKIADKLESAADALVQLGASNGHGNLLTLTPFEHSRARHDLKNLSGVDAIERVLSESEEPLDKQAIAQFLAARGKAIGEATLQSYLSRDERFVSLGRGQWTTLQQAELQHKRLMER
jgi:hypothetical protein